MMECTNKPKTMKRSLVLPEADYYRLHTAIDHENQLGHISKHRLTKMRDLLRHVHLYPIRWFPVDVVSMNSVFELISSKGSVFILRLVYPHDANANENKISVISSLGMRVLGRRTGESLRCDRMHIGKILYQPEICNHFHL